MKKIIILLLALLMSACSAVKPAETLSSMQTEPTETTVADTQVAEETEAPTTKETESVIETPKEEATVPSVTESPEQKPALETTVVTTMDAPTEPINTETTLEPLITPKTPAETVKEENTTENTGNRRNAA